MHCCVKVHALHDAPAMPHALAAVPDSHLPALEQQPMGQVEGEQREKMVACRLFNEQDVDEAIKECNFNKGLGPDGFDGNLLLTD